MQKYKQENQKELGESTELSTHGKEIGPCSSESGSTTNFIDDLEQVAHLNCRVVLREFGSVTVLFLIDKESESELAILDLIQTFIELLDLVFGNNVSEMDLVFNPDKIHYALDEMIVDGILINTDIKEIFT